MWPIQLKRNKIVDDVLQLLCLLSSLIALLEINGTLCNLQIAFLNTHLMDMTQAKGSQVFTDAQYRDVGVVSLDKV